MLGMKLPLTSLLGQEQHGGDKTVHSASFLKIRLPRRRGKCYVLSEGLFSGGFMCPQCHVALKSNTIEVKCVFFFFLFENDNSRCFNWGSQYNLSTREDRLQGKVKNTRVSQSMEPRRAGPQGGCRDHMKEHLGAHTSAEMTGQTQGDLPHQLRAGHGLRLGLSVSYITSAEPLPSRTEIPAFLAYACILLYNQFCHHPRSPLSAFQVEVPNTG